MFGLMNLISFSNKRTLDGTGILRVWIKEPSE